MKAEEEAKKTKKRKKMDGEEVEAKKTKKRKKMDGEEVEAKKTEKKKRKMMKAKEAMKGEEVEAKKTEKKKSKKMKGEEAMKGEEVTNGEEVEAKRTKKKEKRKIEEVALKGGEAMNGEELEAKKTKKKKRKIEEKAMKGEEVTKGEEVEVKKTKKKKKKKMEEEATKEEEVEVKKTMKKKMKKMEEEATKEEEVEVKKTMKKKKKKMEEEATKEEEVEVKKTMKKKKKKMEEEATKEEEVEVKKTMKKKKKKMEEEATKEEEVEVKKTMKKKKKKMEEEATKEEEVEVKKTMKKKKKKMEEEATKEEEVEVKKTILKCQEQPESGSGAEPQRKRKKKVTFQLPDSESVNPTENELLGEETLKDLESYSWTNDRLRPGLVYGEYTAEEDGALKQAIFDYIQDKGWDREAGLEKIFNSGRKEAKGCWTVIRRCLPQRELRRLYSRAHRILAPGTHLGKWTDEEIQALKELHSVHRNDWKRISKVIGRDPASCKDKWRSIKFKFAKTGYNTGKWSGEEQHQLYALVLKSLHVKAQMAKNGQLTKSHRKIRDDINWEFISERMGGRGRLECLTQWYRIMASPMVSAGEWSTGDDQILLERLMEEFPLSEELVEWDSLLKHRSGELCKRRWEQMQRTLGRGVDVRHQHFLEKLESVMKRFAPHLLDTEYDQQFANELQNADADNHETEDI